MGLKTKENEVLLELEGLCRLYDGDSVADGLMLRESEFTRKFSRTLPLL